MLCTSGSLGLASASRLTMDSRTLLIVNAGDLHDIQHNSTTQHNIETHTQSASDQSMCLSSVDEVLVAAGCCCALTSCL